MSAKYNVFLVVSVFIVITGCSTPAPLWHTGAGQIVQSARLQRADEILPSEFGSLVDTFDKGECLLLNDDVDDADKLFKLVILKGELLLENVNYEKKRQGEFERLRLVEQERLEKERIESIAREKEKKRMEAEAVLARIAEKAKQQVEAEARRQTELQKVRKEKIQPVAFHTVKRGETLPLIAALPEVYNEAFLWPLIYRANRDQIRNPQNLWPGQTLRIPRNNSRDDILEARRYAQEKRHP